MGINSEPPPLRGPLRVVFLVVFCVFPLLLIVLEPRPTREVYRDFDTKQLYLLESYCHGLLEKSYPLFFRNGRWQYQKSGQWESIPISGHYTVEEPDAAASSR
ncbi:MAG: hypothetical protein AB1805_16355 [Nitrospirota bacterium]